MPIESLRSLARGLEVLRILNIRDGLTLTQLADASQLARGTAYRMLQSLQAQGYVIRRQDRGTYHVTVKVLSLSRGFDDETWTTEVAKPIIVGLGQEIGWPVSIATLLGTTVTIRENTDDVSPMVFKAVKGGYRMPILGSSSGWVFLAYKSEIERESILEAIERSDDRRWSSVAAQRSSIITTLETIRKEGFYCLPQPAIKSTAISVPIFKTDTNLLGALSIRFFMTALSKDEAIHRFVPLMKNAAEQIRRECSTSHFLDKAGDR